MHREDFWEKLKRLEKDIAYKEAQKRGWFSYTEITCLMDCAQLVAVVQALFSVSSICLTAYAAGLVTLLGSTFLASQVPGTVLVHKQLSSSNNSCFPTFETAYYDESKDEVHWQEPFANENITKSNKPSSKIDWWLDSIMIWHPKDSNLLLESNEKFITSPEMLNEDSKLNIEVYSTTINWEEVPYLTVEQPYYNWKYYLNSASKMFVSYRY